MEEKGFDYINVIPFVDIMLVLLTIVLTTSTFIATGIAVQLPKASQNSEETLKVRTIEIDRKGTIYFTGAPVTISALRETLKALDRNSPFLIRANRDLQLQAFVDVLDTVKNSGFQKVSLQTERK